MSRLPLIGISASSASVPDYDEKFPPLARDFLNRLYSTAVVMAGALPLVLPLPHWPLPDSDNESQISTCGPGALNHNAEVYMTHLDALLLSGGGDVVLGLSNPPEIYKGVDKTRDFWEAALMAAAIKQQKPILGICRGIQLMNIALGGSIWDDIPSQLPEALNHTQTEPRAKTAHEVTLSVDSKLYKILGRETFQVNSIHHQAVREAAPGFKIAGRSSDGLIEALEYEKADFVIGVQWHPESLMPRSPESQKLFAALTQAARQRQSSPLKEEH